MSILFLHNLLISEEGIHAIKKVSNNAYLFLQCELDVTCKILST
jgi:hypothetical protein